MSTTLCVYPWIHTHIGPDGGVKPCCHASRDSLTDEQGAPLNLDTHTFGEIWNSEAMRDIRLKMLRGEQVSACALCYHKESLGAESPRMVANSEWLELPGMRADLQARIDASIAAGGRVEAGMAYMDVRPGNACNLSCRMCGPLSSSRLANDKTVAAWSSDNFGDTGIPGDQNRFEDGRSWHKHPEVIREELIRDPKAVRRVYFAGGEPLTNSGVDSILDVLIEEGVAANIELTFSTNLTILNESMIAKLERFGSTRFFASLDAADGTYDYLRWPSRWGEIVENLERMRAFPFVKVEVTPTVQNCNLLDLTALMTYVDFLGLSVSLNMLYAPVHLSVHALPQRARDLAVERLERFLLKARQRDTNPFMTMTVKSLFEDMKRPSPTPYPELMRHFNLYTNDLDASRSQSFRESCPELFELIAEDGYEWTDELTYFKPKLVSDTAA